ncbi:MAG: rod shape-determining protein RodA [Bacteroidales bacterium]|nr:rod shape-determining protein RodA [Bacteroidales bacterium]
MFIENRQKLSKGFDSYLIGIYIVLVLIGWLTIYSSSYEANDSFSLFNADKAYGRQLIWILTSFALAIFVLLIDGRMYQSYAQYIYIVCMLLITSVLFFGTEISGAKAWIKIGSFSIQPIEFAKFSTALALAKFFSEGKTASERKKIWLFAFIIILIPAAIAILQKDTGSALVFLSFIILFYREGLNENIVLLGVSAIFVFVLTICLNELYTIAILTVVFIVAWVLQRNKKKKIVRNIIVYVLFIGFVFAVNFAYNSILQSHQRQRIDTILGQSVDPKGADFNLNQSKIAIGSGGFFGKGYLNGTQTKLNFVPEQSTDFIFCGIGEEWGFLGSFVIIGLFMALVIRIIMLAEQLRSPFSRIYGYGVASIIFFHLLVNIGMTIGLVPIIGIPLPFISYGGSSIWGFTILLFIFIKLNDAG